MNASWSYGTLCLLLLLFSASSQDQESIQEDVWLEVGGASLKGITSKTPNTGEKLHAFQAIPYAEPPVGDLRFKPPVLKPLPSSGTLDYAFRDLPICPQWFYRNLEIVAKEPLEGQEDCLFLNVYVPEKTFEKRESPRGSPVMVWFHGGAFLFGGGNRARFAPEAFMEADEDVIIVSVNYRLGALGYLCLEDEKTVAGNMGSLDQIAALQWVQRHISHFGGDPDRVTIFGESAGGISVMDLMLSPKATGLFSSAISQSGPGVFMPFMRDAKPPKKYGEAFSSEVGCDASSLSSSELLSCLQKVPLDKVMEGTKMFERFTFAPAVFKPVVDASFSSDPFLPDHRHTLMEEGRFNKVPLMAGGTVDDGSIFMVQFMANDTKIKEVQRDPTRLFAMLFFGKSGEGSRQDRQSTKRMADFLRRYKPEVEDTGEKSLINRRFSRNNWQNLEHLFTNVQFLAPIETSVQKISRASDQPVFYYNYRHKGEVRLMDMYGYDQSQGDLGVGHADEIFVQFANPARKQSEEDAKMTRKMNNLWTGFAASGGSPNWSGSVGWNPYPQQEDKAMQYHILDLGELRLPDVENDPEEQARSEMLVHVAKEMAEELKPPPIEEEETAGPKRTIEVDMTKAKKVPETDGKAHQEL